MKAFQHIDLSPVELGLWPFVAFTAVLRSDILVFPSKVAFQRSLERVWFSMSFVRLLIVYVLCLFKSPHGMLSSPLCTLIRAASTICNEDSRSAVQDGQIT